MTSPPDLFLDRGEFERIRTILERLRQDSGAKVVFLGDKNGQQIAAVGSVGSLDTTALASLTAGNVAATDGLARLIGERQFSILFHEGERDNIHISVVGERLLLVVIFDDRSSLGLVRLRVRRATAELERVVRESTAKGERERESSPGPLEAPFSEITPEDIERLFSP